MATFPSTDWTRKSGDIFEAARRGPVTITQHKRPAFVVLTYDEYQRLIAPESRRHFTIENVPDAVFEKAQAALGRLEQEVEAP